MQNNSHNNPFSDDDFNEFVSDSRNAFDNTENQQKVQSTDNIQKSNLNTSQQLEQSKITSTSFSSTQIHKIVNEKEISSREQVKISIKEPQKQHQEKNPTAIFVIALLFLSMALGMVGSMLFAEKKTNAELVSKIKEQSQQIYDYKYGTLP